MPMPNGMMTPEESIAYWENDDNFVNSNSQSQQQSTSSPQPTQQRYIPRQPSGSFGSHGQWKKPPGYNQYPQWVKSAIDPDGIPMTVAGYAKQGLNVGTPVGLVIDAFNDEDRLDRKVGNIIGNVIGGVISSKSGNSGAGALAGGWVSDRILDVFDNTDGKNAKPTALLNQHLSKDPIMQIAIYEEQLRQARLQQKEMERQKMAMARMQAQSLQQKEMERQIMAMARMQAQSLQPSYSRSFGNRTLPAFTNNGTMVNPYEDIGM
jgi:hypothetical protein